MKASVAFFLCVSVAFGCSTDFSVPVEAQLGCASAADCPSGWACNEKVGRCVKTENMDTVAPQLVGDVIVDPPVLRKDRTAKVTFTVDEELSSPPAVTLSAGTDRLLTPASPVAPPAYVFSYTPAGDEPPGVESPISIVLADKSGNQSGKLSGRSLRFDFIAPSAQNVSIEGSPVMIGGGVAVRFALSEGPVNDPEVRFEDGNLLVKDSATEGLNYVYTGTATGTETADGTEADFDVLVDASDTAGNTLDSFDLGTVRFDFKKPALDGAPVVDPPAAKAGTFVTATFRVTEELSAMPVVKVGGRGIPGKKEPGLEYVFGAAVEEGDPEGEQAITIEFYDLAGNSSG
ncbi:MAG: hypothetical protein HY897_00350, partial [Deltaproteobacteria bacterium]|nr:hypothetical protein [Deltaproteobacteria bacterium]